MNTSQIMYLIELPPRKWSITLRNSCWPPPSKCLSLQDRRREGSMGPDLSWQSVGAWLPSVLWEFSYQIHAQVVSYGIRPSRCTVRGQGLIWHIMAPNPKMIYGCKKLSYLTWREHSFARN